MNQEMEALLSLIESDMGEAAGARFVRVAAEYFQASASPSRPVSTRLTAPEIMARLEGAFPEGPGELAAVVERLESVVVAESNWLYHPRYMGHQVTAPLPAAVWADSVTSALNQSVAVQEMSPVITVIERQIIQWMTGLVGWGAEAGGTMTSGGTEATFTALLAARARLLPDAWENGLQGELPVVLCGEHSHYAVTRAVAELGLGLKRAIVVPSRGFRMDVVALRERLNSLRDRKIPIMAVVATAGSTATGSFDPIAAIADVCEEFGVWLHVDGAHGASALLSARHRGVFDGIERADSIAWDPHKMMLMPLSAGVLLVRKEAELEAAFSQKAPYLFHGSAEGRTPDQGARSFQCSRRSDALKLWVALHRYGTAAFGVLYDYLCGLAVELYELIRAHPKFEAIHSPECNILCFRYVGNDNHRNFGNELDAGLELDSLNLRLRKEYNTAGTGWITSTVLDGRRVLRVTLINPRIRSDHLAALIDELEETASRMGAS